MARYELSKHLPADIISLIQKKLLPRKSSYTFLKEIQEIYIYHTCFVCKKLMTVIPVKLLLKIYNFSKKDELIDKSVLHYHCDKCYPLFLMRLMKNQIILKTK